VEPRLTMWARGAARSRGRKPRVTRSRPTTLVSSMVCQSWSLPSATGSRPRAVPALLTSRSAWPWRSPTAAVKASTEAGSVTSRGRVVAPTSSARGVRRLVRRAPATTWKPARASWRVLAAPIPLEAPVTTAIRSAGMGETLLSAWRRVDPLGGEDVDQAALGDHGRPVLLQVVGVAAGGRPVQAQVVLDPVVAAGLDRAADGQPLAPEPLAEHGQAGVRAGGQVPGPHAQVGARAPQLPVDQSAQHGHGVGPAAVVHGGHHRAVVGLEEGALLGGEKLGHGCGSAGGRGPGRPRLDEDGYCTGPGWARQASPAAARSSQKPG